MTHTLVDKAWRQAELTDNDPEPSDIAPVLCAECGLPTELDDVHMTDGGALCCFSCWCDGFQLRPLEAQP